VSPSSAGIFRRDVFAHIQEDQVRWSGARADPFGQRLHIRKLFTKPNESGSPGKDPKGKRWAVVRAAGPPCIV
jgi:hypothetical protein